MLSKIEYGLSIYGNCAKTNLNLIKTPLHAAIRCSLKAFRTSPITNLLAESGFFTLENYVEIAKCRLLYLLFTSSTNLLYQPIQLNKKRITSPKKPSALMHIASLAKKLNIYTHGVIHKTLRHPWWNLSAEMFISELANHPKNRTSADAYRQLFRNIHDILSKENWSFFYTDGSKSDFSTSLAIVNDIGETIETYLLLDGATVFDAEAVAVAKSLEHCKKLNTKNIICTDSYSVFEAVKNPLNKNGTIFHIQQLLIALKGNAKILWVPSHVGITGNEFADSAAKLASKQPLITTFINSKKWCYNNSISKLQNTFTSEWENYNHPYKSVNPLRTPLVLPPSVNSTKSRCFIRLRLGHSLLTHKYLLSKDPAPTCHFCNVCPLTLTHLLLSCQHISPLRKNILNNNNPIQLLSSPTLNNIDLLYKFILALNLQKEI